MTRNQISAAKAKGSRRREQAGTRGARVREQATARGIRVLGDAGAKGGRVREQAIKSRTKASKTAARFTPVAIGVGITARRGIHLARRWAAPRVEQAGRTLEKEVAPKVAAMLADAAHRIEPPRKRSLRWPLLGAGAAALAGGGAAAALVLSRKGKSASGEEHMESATPVPVSAPGSAGAGSQAGVGGHSERG